MANFTKHPHFDLWLHTDQGLEEILGIKIAARETIHDWPLSTVQKVTTVEGGCFIYKIQQHATVEPGFYQSAESDLLPKHKYLGKVNHCDAMTFEYISGPRLADLEIDDISLCEIGRKLQKAIGQIKGDLPVYTDIRNEAKWNAFAFSVIERLSALIKTHAFPNVDSKIVNDLQDWAANPKVIDIINTESTFTHGDPNGDNIFVMPDGFKLIDWQRPRYAPYDIDMAALLQGKGFNPYNYLRKEVVQLFYFIRIDWITQCKAVLFPKGTSYEKQFLNACDALLKLKAMIK